MSNTISVFMCANPMAFAPKFKEFRELASKNWKKAVVDWVNWNDCYYNKTKEEYEFILAAEELLKELCPDEFKNGVHLVANSSGFMGEHIYVHEGNIHTTMHRFHNKCNEARVIYPSQDFGMYCCPCEKGVSPEELRLF